MYMKPLAIEDVPLIRRFFHLNWTFVFFVSAIATIGFAMMYSAAKGNLEPWALRQIKLFLVFFPVMLLIALINLKIWLKLSYVAYFSTLLLLVAVEVFGSTAMGATRWIVIEGIRIQPSELMKISLVFALARYFHYLHQDDVAKPIYLITPLLMILVPFGLILKQPDLGTAFIILMLGGIMFFVAGVKIWKFAVVAGLGLVSIPLMWKYWLYDYQKKRILTFLNPEADPLGAGYNIMQSKIAIGSGGIFGKGFLKGSQSQLSFLPEKQTDFIFTMLAEEFGFVGGASVIIFYMILIAYGLSIALNCRNHFGRIMAIGITSIFFLHVFINIAMVMGMIPIVGAPLPLLSYGGTIMLTIMVGCGLLLNVFLYRDVKIKRAMREVL